MIPLDRKLDIRNAWQLIICRLVFQLSEIRTLKKTAKAVKLVKNAPETIVMSYTTCINCVSYNNKYKLTLPVQLMISYARYINDQTYLENLRTRTSSLLAGGFDIFVNIL